MADFCFLRTPFFLLTLYMYTHVSCDDVGRDDGPLVTEHLVGGGGGEVCWLGGQVGPPVAGPGQGGGRVAKEVEHKL